MHDTLQNRGRITYDRYGPEQQAEIKATAQQFLAGDIDEITDFDSLRKVREYFLQIRLTYRKLKQNIEAVQRQLDTDPQAAAKLLGSGGTVHDVTKQITPGQQRAVTSAGTAGGIENLQDRPLSNQEESKNNPASALTKKRQPIDKQTAFIEYKAQSQEGKQLESSILLYRDDVKTQKQTVKNMTATINATK